MPMFSDRAPAAREVVLPLVGVVPGWEEGFVRPPTPLLVETRGFTKAERRSVQTTAQPAAEPIPYSEPTKMVTNWGVMG